jgi:hypothetical protein
VVHSQRLSAAAFPKCSGCSSENKDAAIHGDPEVHIGSVAKFGAKLQGLAPGITAEALTVINRLLPDPGTGKAIKKGSDSESRGTQNPMTVLTRRAEIANNQI